MVSPEPGHSNVPKLRHGPLLQFHNARFGRSVQRHCEACLQVIPTNNEMKMNQLNQSNEQSTIYAYRKTQVLFWNSSEPLSREYIRGCSFIHRQHIDRHHRCGDFVHTGYVAIHRSTHLFMNFLCNKFLNNSQHPSVHLYSETCCT
jgi:hypothetical protein